MNTYLRPRNFGCRITQFTYMGYEALTLQNESLRITVLPGKGTDIIEFLYKPLDVDFLWLSYPGLRHRQLSPEHRPDAHSSFLDSYPGGWQEILPNFGDPCQYKGAALGLHDEVSLLPWSYEIRQDDPSCVAVQFSVRCVRTPFRIEKTLTLRPGCVLQISERITNEAAEQMDFTWAHHPALGGEFLDETCRISVPPCRVRTLADYVSCNSRTERAQDCLWPFVKARDGQAIDLSVVPPASTKSHDLAVLYGFEEGWYAVASLSKKIGFAMAWDKGVFKWLYLWQVYRGWSGYPWYGMNYNIGLEPCTSFPPSLVKAMENNTQRLLNPGESLETQLCVVVFKDLGVVGNVTLNGEVSASSTS